MAQYGEDRELRRRPARRGAGSWHWRLRQTVGILEIPAECDACAHQAEKIGGHAGDTDLLGSAIGLGHWAAAGVNSGEVLERALGAVAQVQEIGVGKREVLHVALTQVAACQDQTVGRLIRNRMQQHRVGDAEYRSAGADA